MGFVSFFSNFVCIQQFNSKYHEELKTTTGNDDLTDLLNEAKHTILELQHEIESLKSEIEQLRQQNRALAATAQIEPSVQNQTNLKTVNEDPTVGDSGGKESKPTPVVSVTVPPSMQQAQKDSPVKIPLEPVVIVNDNKLGSSANKNSNPKLVSKSGREQQMPSDQTSQSDNTFVV